MILKFAISFLMTLFVSIVVLNRISAMTRFMKGQYERKSDFMTLIVFLTLMCVSIALYLTLY